ncbi:MAG TPA: DUF2461 domain-containing protein [Acidobacteriaceae bacterium]|jgi:uncharacterized protein (TIGR02453 family)|nr:DUF2461 domain-containing protein [Acidobacteriaceae bacterium]
MHFTPEALKFLRGLKRNNDREWFEARRDIFEREIKAPMYAVIAEINDALAGFAPEHVRDPRKAMFRIYRDTRFSADKRPYKEHLGVWWVRSGMEKTSGAGFYFHIAPKEVVVAAGAYMPTPEQLLAIRRHIDASYAEVRGILDGRKLRSLMTEWDGEPMKRVPKGFSQDSPAAELLKCRKWGVSATLPAELATDPKLVKEVARRFEAAAPLIRFLNAPILPVRRPIA